PFLLKRQGGHEDHQQDQQHIDERRDIHLRADARGCWPHGTFRHRTAAIGLHCGWRKFMRTSVLLLCLGCVVSLAAQSTPSYKITHTYTLGGDGAWDYIVPDPPNHRLFIGRENRVMVVDEDKGTLLGEVTGIQGAHGTAIAAASGHGFATSGNDQSVVMFDLKTFKMLGRIPAAEAA